jgi:hypothetical protein
VSKNELKESGPSQDSRARAGADGQKPSDALPVTFPKSGEPVPVSKVTGPSVDLKKVIGDSVAGAPLPSESAIQAAAARKVLEDKKTEDGQTGKIRGKYKPRSAPNASRLVKPGTSVDSKKLAFRKVGYEIADTIVIAGRTLGGTDWECKIVKDEKTDEILFDEKHNLREAWADMAEQYEWGKFPAWAAVALATSAYILPRLNAPSTLSRWDKVKLWIANRRAKKQAENGVESA